LVNEVDLYNYVVPPLMGVGLTNCVEVARVDRLKVVAHLGFSLPWPLSQREILVEGFGVDMIDEGKILLVRLL